MRRCLRTSQIVKCIDEYISSGSSIHANSLIVESSSSHW